MLTIILTGDAINSALLDHIEKEGISLDNKNVKITIISKRGDNSGIEATIKISNIEGPNSKKLTKEQLVMLPDNTADTEKETQEVAEEEDEILDSPDAASNTKSLFAKENT